MNWRNSLRTETRQKLVDWLIFEEDCVLLPYKDSLGIWSFGIGRNLQDVGLRSREEAIYLCNNDITHFVNFISKHYPFFENLDENRKMALVNFCFSGEGNLAKFPKMMEALRMHQFSIAADELLHNKNGLPSLYAKQVPKRAARISNVFLNGKLPYGI